MDAENSNREVAKARLSLLSHIVNGSAADSPDLWSFYWLKKQRLENNELPEGSPIEASGLPHSWVRYASSRQFTGQMWQRHIDEGFCLTLDELLAVERSIGFLAELEFEMK